MTTQTTFTTSHLIATVIALIAFAGNSVLCRLALLEQSIDATSFTIVRLLSGAITLIGILYLLGIINKKKNKTSDATRPNASWLSAFMLFAYAASFSYAYIMLDAGLGALILFGCVQLTMISVSIIQKQPLTPIKWIGISMAFLGLVFLINAQSDLSQANFSLYGFILMVFSGIAWASYTILGKGSKTPLLDTSANFTKSLVFVIPLLVFYFFINLNISLYGIFLSIMSGAVTSGVGYAIWYYALNGLTAVKAGVVQLLVPVIAALGGLAWIGETITIELIMAQVVILGGIALVMFSPNRARC